MTKEQALHNFYSQFLDAYDENTVPKNAKLPRLTYMISTCGFGESVTTPISLWYQSNSWKEITEKKDEIALAISAGGKIISCDKGAIWIKRGTPFAQRMSDENDTIRRIVMNIEIEFITL